MHEKQVEAIGVQSSRICFAGDRRLNGKSPSRMQSIIRQRIYRFHRTPSSEN